MSDTGTFVHETAVIDDGAKIGHKTKIWHFVHVMGGAVIGERCTVGQGCFIGNVTIGDGCKIQNHVSVYDGVTLERDVFVGPSCVFTNVINPRAEIDRKDEFRDTRVGHGATLGANATILCGVTIGRYAFVAAGAVVTSDIAPHALVMGVPARRVAWMCVCGEKLPEPEGSVAHCLPCGRDYRTVDGNLAIEEPSSPAITLPDPDA